MIMGVVGYVPGAYDMFHIGHLNILKRARRECDHLIAGVVTDEVLVRAKGRAAVVPLAERLEIVRSINVVDEAVTDVSSDKFVMWQQLKFDVLFKGDDWKGTEKGDRLEADLGAVGVRVVYFPYTVHTSSTALRQLINAGGSEASAPADGAQILPMR
ncbi:adenylyltransferase/cytidyltransferase family protein [Actinomadura scrupuli]|uniref:adenylyltransferase/cytidyltransferase family protein n=1 Tax=Actinomadura scrupuli TaxID=559629 RepID=UPI003D96EBD4